MSCKGCIFMGIDGVPCINCEDYDHHYTAEQAKQDWEEAPK